MNDLIIIETLTPAIFSEPGGIEALISKLERDVRAVEIDISTAFGRSDCKSLAYKISRSKTALDGLGKDLVAGWKAQSAKVDAERRTVRDRLDALKEEVLKPVADWELLETGRVAGHLNAITMIEDLARFEGEPTSTQIGVRIERLTDLVAAGRDWQEFAEQAATAKNFISDRLTALKQGAEKREADLAELDALRAEKAERDRKDQEAADAAAAEQRAKDQAEAKRLAEAEVTERARIAAEQAVEAERKRLADVEAAERAATEKRERNKKHRAKILGDAAAALEAAGLSPADATTVVVAIAANKIPNISFYF